MAKKYTASLDVAWKRIHRCCHCDSEYVYPLARNVSAEGPSEEAAQANLMTAITKLLERANEICDPVACPACGFVQPEMILEKDRNLRWINCVWGIAAIVFLIIGVVNIMSANGSEGITGSYETVLWSRRWAWLLFLAPLFFYFGGRLGNPNRDLQRNLEKTQEREDVVLLTQGMLPDPMMEKRLPRGYVHAFFISLVVTLLAFLLPSLFEATLPDDRANPTCVPGYFGPGDPVRVYFPFNVSSIKGYWNSHVAAELEAEGLETPKNVTTHSHRKDWGQNLSVKSRDRSNSSSIYTDIVVPDGEDIAEKDVTVRYIIALAYPVVSGGNSFEDRMELHPHSDRYKLSATGTGTRIIHLEFYSYIAAMLLFLCHLFIPAILIQSLRSHVATPITTPEDIKSETEDVFSEPEA